jgi:hypothetical protein
MMAELSRAKVQVDLVRVKRKRGRPSHLSEYLQRQADLFPVELAVACWAPHLIPGASPVPAPIVEPRAASAPPAGEGAGPLGKAIRITLSTRVGKRGVSA